MNQYNTVEEIDGTRGIYLYQIELLLIILFNLEESHKTRLEFFFFMLHV